MPLDSSLLFGLVLIAAGIFLATAAFFFVYRGREADQGSDEEASPAEPQAEPASEPSAPSKIEQAARPPEAAAPRPPPPAAARAALEPARLRLPEVAATTGESPMTDQPSSAPPLPVPDRRLLPVVTILRDEVSGDLALQVETRIYRSLDEVRVSADWTRVEYAARDLARWVQPPPPAPPPARPTEEKRDGDNAANGSMVEQINRVLEERLAGRRL
jgi:hypothetical protein